MRVRFPWGETLQAEACEEFVLDVVSGIYLKYHVDPTLELLIVTSNNYTLDTDHEVLKMNTAIVSTDFLFNTPDDPFDEEAWEQFTKEHDE